MKHKYSFLLAISIILFSAVSASASYHLQPDTPKYKPVIPVYRGVVGDSAVIPKYRQKQQRDFLQGTNLYPPKPRNEWQFALNGGGFFVSGDVRSQGGYGFGASIQKSIGYVISLRTLYFHGITYGQNWEANSGLLNNAALNGVNSKATDYAHTGNGTFFMNYKNSTNELLEQVIFAINNIGFHKRSLDRKINLYIGVGGGGMQYKTWYNALDANGKMYNYSSVKVSTNIKDRSTILSQLKSIQDKTYETQADGQTDEASLFGGTFRPVLTGTIGLGYHVSKRLELSIFELATLTNDRLLDGQQWQEHPHADPALTGPYDNTHYVYLTLGYSFGVGRKAVEPLYWQNPMEYTYDALQTLMKKNVDDLIDTDDDGVVDRFDREPNSAPGAIVDTHGVTKDSDGDGIPDYKDKEPYTPAGAKVDSNGVTLPEYRPIPRNQLDSVIRHDVNSGAINNLTIPPPGPAVVQPGNNNVTPITQPGNNTVTPGNVVYLNGNVCNLTNFPTVNFELDKYNIQPEFFAHLHEIAMAMIACPDQKMVAIGNTDARDTNSYNDVLSWERVNKCIDYIVTKYGISRDRFIVKFNGKVKPFIPGLPEHGVNPVYESRQYLNRRVEFHWAQKGETGNSNPPKPQGPSKAGKEW